jgi:hypothetical protein
MQHLVSNGITKMSNTMFKIEQEVRKIDALSADLYKVYLNPLLNILSSTGLGGKIGNINCWLLVGLNCFQIFVFPCVKYFPWQAYLCHQVSKIHHLSLKRWQLLCTYLSWWCCTHCLQSTRHSDNGWCCCWFQ